MTDACTSPLSLAVFADKPAAVEALAERVVEAAAVAIAERGCFRLALSGGSTPRPLYERLASTELQGRIDWSKVVVTFCDDRCVAADSPDSNLRLVRESLLEGLDATPAEVIALDGTLAPGEAAADLAARLGQEPIDLAVLGMGDDGHTASLFPGGAELTSDAPTAEATTSPKGVAERVTLSVAALERARERVFLVTGAGKAGPMAQVVAELGSTPALPAAIVAARGTRSRWFLDEAAAAELPEKSGLSDFGMIGLAVMGRNLAMNVLDSGFDVAAWNLEPELARSARAESGDSLVTTASLAELVATLERPRRLMMMIQAGAPVDSVLEALLPLLDEGDVVIDGGNSWFQDTRRRERRAAEAGIRFIGVGVSGGEEGARRGPALMPGGAADAYARIRPVLEAIAAKTEHGPCVTHVGEDGAGHFVKMVHNGIEYADMQFIAEAYDLLGRGLGMAPPELASTFRAWNEGELESFLIEITASIFETSDGAGGWLVDRVLDRAGQKGTGRMTASIALELGVAIPSIAAAIDARVLSSRKETRERFEPLLAGPGDDADADITVEDVEAALFASKVCAYAQGMELIAAGAAAFDWTVDPAEISRIWTGGCIIRARFLETMMRAWREAPGLENLLVAEDVRAAVDRRQGAWRRVVAAAQLRGIPVPGMAASLAYYDALRTARLPQNLVQAQRDAFGAHTYRTVDDPGGPAVHSDWLA